jgi:anti-sigma factor RsiW
MTCDESRIYLAAYLDDELDVADSLRVQRHLAECVACRRTQDEQTTLRTALRDPELYAQPSADFAKRIQTAVRHAAKEEARQRGAGLWSGNFRWAALAAALIVVVAAGAVFESSRHGSSREQLIASAVVGGHIRSLQPGHLVDVPSSDHHTVKPWFQGKLDFSPPVPDLTSQGWTLIGGRLDYADGRPVAALVYGRRMHNINVFLWPNTGSADGTIHQEDAQGYQILHWSTAEMNYWVVSDLNRSELMELAQLLRSQ